MVDKIIAYEAGELEQEEVVELFQGLVNTGLAWSLQGHYGRTAEALISQGFVTRPSEKNYDDAVSELTSEEREDWDDFDDYPDENPDDGVERAWDEAFERERDGDWD